MKSAIRSIPLLFFGFVTMIFLTAGHHFESDLAKEFPHFDLEDLFVFPSKDRSKTVFVLDFNPTTKKDSANFSDRGIYKFHIASQKNFSEGFTMCFTYKNGKIQFYYDNIAENKLSQTGTLVAEGPINRILALSNGMRLWTGSTHDNFQGNALGVEAFKKKMEDENQFDLSTFDVGEKGNFFGRLVSSVIIIEIPNEMLPKQIYYYASTEVQEGPDHWHTVNRIGYVLFPHLYLLNPELKAKYVNLGAAEIDPEVKQSIVKNITKYAKGAGLQKDPQAYAEQLAEKIYPDVIPYKVGTEALYTVEDINGRPLQADAMNTALGLLIGSDKPVDDKVSVKEELYQDQFPYITPIDNAYLNASEKTITVDVGTSVFDGHNTEAAATKSSNPANEKKGGMVWKVLAGLAIIMIVILFIRRKKGL